MEIICRDIIRQWMNCWQETIIAGILSMLISRQSSQIWNQNKVSDILFFVDGVFLYYMLYVTLLSRTIGFRREVRLWPLAGLKISSGEFHYIIENVLLFIPFGVLLCMTLYAYGKKSTMKTILLTSFLTSMSIELLQYIFACGKSETADVITNVLGAVLGYLMIRLRRR